MTSEDIEKPDAEDIVLPVVMEVPTVGKRTIETGGVRVTKTVSQREVVVDETASHEEVTVERTSIGREVADTDVPVIRQEGETLVIPVLEEVPVLVKRIVLVEEIRITRSRREVAMPQRLALKVEHVSVEPIKDVGEAPATETTKAGQSL